jgi:hypothetical protein
MKILLFLVVSVVGLTLGGCADQSLISDDEYKAMKGPAPFSPDPMQHIPVPSDRPAGY